MFDELKPLMQNGERYIVVEGGKPEYVLMRFRDYTAIISGGPTAAPGRAASPDIRHADLGRANAEMGALSQAGAGANAASLMGMASEADDPNAVRLEDLAL